MKSQLIGIVLMILITAAYAFTSKSVTSVLEVQKSYQWLDSIDETNFEGYIKSYAKYALIEQKKNGVPASITLAQGLLESSSGQSKLAVIANNHFGIKCFSKTCKTGHCINYTDDSHKDFFLTFKTVLHSYSYHSQFLKKKRYRHLFRLDVSDYKNWAHGLKKAGYATDPNYANKLISIIEKYELNELH